MKRILILVVLGCTVPLMHAQDILDRYDSFQRQAAGAYCSFRDSCNRRYLEFLRQSWMACEAHTAIEPPKEEWLPPLEIAKDAKRPAEHRPVFAVPIAAPREEAWRPKPLLPMPHRTEGHHYCGFEFFHTPVKVRVPDNVRLKIGSVNGNDIADAWEILCRADFESSIADCLQLKEDMHLCDWAYLLLLYDFSVSCLEGENESLLLTAYLYSQSGYQMRLARADGNLILLVATEYVIYGKHFFTIDGKRYWAIGSTSPSISAVRHDYPEGKPLSLAMTDLPRFAWMASEPRHRSSSCPVVASSCRLNLNLLAFLASYPNAQWGDNPLTRWAIYANTPLDPSVQEQLYPALRLALSGKSLPEAANLLLGFVQKAFDYQCDDSVWGEDRALFPDEVLYYPYSDCEDRSILFARLVNDLLGLDAVLVHYPGHLATAVRFPVELPGDCLELASGRYLVCDPTYVGASIGMSMPGVEHSSAKAILLR